MILKYDFWILKKYYIKTIRFIINNFIFQIIHSYFAHTTKYKNHIIQKYMKSYFIFTIVLTVAYIIYYAVIIAHDLYGKKGTDKPDEEVFDLGAPEEEESVAVTESESGFSIGSENYETESTATSSETSPEEDIKDKPGTAQEKLERLKAEAEEQMEETTPYLSDARTSEEMYKAMISKGRLDNRPEIKWNPIQDRL